MIPYKKILIVLFLSISTVCFANETSFTNQIAAFADSSLGIQKNEGLTIDKGVATLIASLIAAVLSFFSFIQNKKVEVRAANRKKLEPYIDDLAESIHEIMAFSNIMLKNKSEESLNNYKNKASAAKEKLKSLRRKIRYPLWGIDDYIQQLSRISDYTLYTLKDKKVAIKNVQKGKLLAKSIDRCVKNCYIHGRCPTILERLIIRYRAYAFTKVRNNYKKARCIENNGK